MLSLPPAPPASGSTYGLDTEPDDISTFVDSNPIGEELLYKTLYAWIFDGLPRAVGYNPPPLQYAPAVELLINHSERFVIAHEYSHLLLNRQVMPAGANPSWIKEYGADASAFLLEVMSAKELDGVAPNIALQGALFTLAARDVVCQALGIAWNGRIQEAKGSESHPPPKKRIDTLIAWYRKYVGEGVYEVPIDGGKTRTIDLGVKGALVPTTTLYFLWSRIQGRFLEAHKNGLKPHPLWDKTACG
jgi:hypothetical protein